MTGPELAQIRQEIGLQQTDVAKLMRVSRQTVSNWERGFTRVPHCVGMMMQLMRDVPQACEWAWNRLE